MKNTTLQNCVIWSYYDGNEENTYAYNSYLWLDGSPQRLSVYNCIVSGIGQMVGWSAAYNSVSIEKNFNNCSNYDCWFFDEYDMVFESFTGEDYVWTTEPLILKAEVASQCLGVDGNQVGIHGGNMPYATRPTYMTSYRTTVDQHSTSDGKLNVHIEVVEGDK